MNKDYTENKVNTDQPETPVNEDSTAKVDETAEKVEEKTEEVAEEKVDAAESAEPAEKAEAEEEPAKEEKAEPKKDDEGANKAFKRAVPPRPNDPVKKASTDNTVKKPLLSDAAKKRIKGLIFPVIMTAIIILGVFFIINHKNAQEEEEVVRIKRFEGSEDDVILENDDLIMTFHPLTTRFEITVKSTGQVWRSNPEESSIPASDGSKKAKELSTLIIQYGSEKSATGQDYDNYKYSIEKGVYDVEATKDYIKVSYSVGDVEKEFIIPPVTTEEKYNAWMSVMSKDDQNFVKRCYKKFDYNNPDKNETNEEYKPEKLLENYPIYETEVIYVLRNTTKENMKEKCEQIFEAAGYTRDDYNADKELSNAEASSDKPVFNINVYYRLEGKDLVVDIPYSEIQYKEANPLTTLTVLPFFGAAGKDENDGYLFVPEGGGALIKFNNGKTSQPNYATKVYGRDRALKLKTLMSDKFAVFNTFGMIRQDSSFLCILEDCASYATINADISGRSNISFNYVNAKYNGALYEQYELGDQASTNVFVYLDLPREETITQRYRFIDSGNYYDMALAYQGYLKQNYSQEFTLNNDTEAPVAIEVVAAADKIKQILGVPTARPLKLTTFKEAKEIIEQLQGEGMKNMSVKLSGWMNGGVNQKILKKVKLVASCGSASDLKKFAQSASNLGVDLYLDGVTQYEYDSDLLDGFNSFTDSARFISKERAKIYQYSAITYAQREGSDTYYLLHADLEKTMTDNLYNAAKKYGANVSFRETGKEVSGDYYKKKMTTREQNKKAQMEKLAQISQDTKIMINAGNVYAAVYSDMITNMDLRGSEHNLIDEFVPFYQMAIHGYKNYTGNPVNLASDPTEEVLLSAEYGAGLQFTLMKESPFALQKTLYTEYFGANFDSWHDRMISTYDRYNKELGHVFNQEMVGHETLEDGLTCTTYADGTKVYVNYNYSAKSVNGKSIAARDYLVVR
ncbi:MAG: hypothetical protein IKS85_07605 [Lachnospiraceae bacterium]|nr:hypothetical protein [Lachnospiraceae bacterium]